jgi:hypothetical protein
MHIFIQDDLVYIQVANRGPVVVLSEENMIRSPHLALIKLQDAINSEMTQAYQETYHIFGSAERE